MSLRHRKAPGPPLGVQAARLKLPKTRTSQAFTPNLLRYSTMREDPMQSVCTLKQACSAFFSTRCWPNHVALQTEVLGANQHESHWVFGICYNNTSDIVRTTITGDMHSIN